MSITYFPTGGIGNLIFCHNAAYSFAKENDLQLKALINESVPNRPSITAYRETIFQHLDMVDEVDYSNVYDEPEFTFKEIHPDARILRGYFQSYKYTGEYQDDITKLFRSNCAEIVSKIGSVYKNISQGFETIMVHVRRGDYISKSEYHTVLPEEYYETALNKFDTSKQMVLVFSEEPVDHWKVWEELSSVHFVDIPDPLETLWLMTMCTHFIIANSSLSLQAYYMRENKNAQLVYPTQWFGPLGPKFDMNDLIPHN